MDHLLQMHLLKNQTDFNKLRARELQNKKQQQFQTIRKQKMEQKSRKTIPHSFVEHELQMHLFKNQTDFNKLKSRELENKQSQTQFKNCAKNWKLYFILCRSPFTNAPIKNQIDFNKFNARELEMNKKEAISDHLKTKHGAQLGKLYLLLLLSTSYKCTYSKTKLISTN